ncbi:MAG TPA: cyclopropane-fatty-acyl-phospholipid synthase family protein [Steroidobacteraceae bacterium]|jgi:cyclopropane-fatty-acyl-phospholipid synthase|nr:cyclopropane-fatty-acyl-phospholipid synthase family protein [Steroidobacteraceae bacterium]
MNSSSPLLLDTAHLARPARTTLLARLGRKLLLDRLRQFEHGELKLAEPDGREHVFGRRHAGFDLSCTVHFDHPQVFADAAFGGTVGAGEAYIRGLWRCNDLTSLVRIFVANREQMNRLDSRWSLLSRPLLKLFHWANRNSKHGSARNIAAHYDLGNELYRLMLDDTMAYSCAIFPRADATLAEGSEEKFDAVCRKLDLKPTDHVLEIGTGWGGFAIHAVQRYGCRVTTTTISAAQRDYAVRKIAALRLADRITVLLEDYRDLNGDFGGPYDKLVSIEMVEAVGASFLDGYFRQCSRLLKPEGAMLLQAITIQDQIYEQALKSVDYIKRYVFPGSFIPSVQALSKSLSKVSDLKIFHLEDIGPHYARTLRLWRERFFRNLPKVRELGYSDSFVRLWEYYLCYCEGGFMERQLGTVQMLLTKPASRRAPVGGAAP